MIKPSPGRRLRAVEDHYHVEEIEQDLLDGPAQIKRLTEETIRGRQRLKELREIVAEGDQELHEIVVERYPKGSGNEAVRKKALEELRKTVPGLMETRAAADEKQTECELLEGELRSWEVRFRSAGFRAELMSARLRYLSALVQQDANGPDEL